MRKSQAIAVWGQPDGRCRRVAPYDPDDLRRGCDYGGFVKTRSGTQSGRPFAGFTFLPSGEVTSVHIGLIKFQTRDRELERWYDMAARKVRPFRTSRGIGLRSTMQAAREAYGIPTPTNVPSYRADDFLSSVIVRKGGACTVFYSVGSAPPFTYVDVISVNAAQFCPAEPSPSSDQELRAAA